MRHLKTCQIQISSAAVKNKAKLNDLVFTLNGEVP